MKRYRYRAKNDQGKIVTGEVEGKSPQHAAKLVRQQGFIVLSIKSTTSDPFGFLKSITERVSSGDIVTFTRQLSTMINAGLPITEALVILRGQTRGLLQKIVAQVLSDVEEGQSLSSSMSKHPNTFSKTYIALIKSGEIGGVLDEVLVKLSENLEKQQEFRGKVKGALIYPAIIVLGMFGVGMLMMIFVLPRMATLYEQFNADLPITTKLLLGFSKYSVKLWPLIILLFGFGAWGIKSFASTENGKTKIDQWIFKIPVFGDLQRQIILTDLTRTMSLMVGSGVSIIDALDISAQVSKNSIVTDALIDTKKMVEKGFPMAFAFSKHPEAFPFILSQMIAVGEETGKMDEVLEKVSHVFEVESEQKVKALTSMIEPIILIILGIGVAFLVISIIMPIYNLTTQI